MVTADRVNSTTSCDLAETKEETCDVETKSSGGLAEEPFQHVGPSWDCSQVENELEERDAMDWFMDDELTRHNEEVSEHEEETAVTEKKAEGHRRRKCRVHQDLW